MKSPDLEVNVLVSMENVTSLVSSAVQTAKSPAEQFALRRAVIAKIERDSQQKTGLRFEVVTLYQGGEYWLYRYKKYTDVRLVFAPEQQIASFGGDPDNFTYPRYDLDRALFRVYENGKALDTKDYLKWNPQRCSQSGSRLCGRPSRVNVEARNGGATRNRTRCRRSDELKGPQRPDRGAQAVFGPR